MENQLLHLLRIWYLGNYYLTLEREGAIGEGMIFNDINEALFAYQNGYVHLAYTCCCSVQAH